MSLDATNWARDIRTGKSTRKAVLMALADYHHSRRDLCQVSIPMLVKYTELNWKTVTAALDQLQYDGIITLEKHPGRATIFHLNMENTPSKLGAGSGGRNAGNLQPAAGSKNPPTPSNFGATTPSKIGRGTTPSKTGGAPPPKTERTPSKLGAQTGEQDITGKEPPIVPHKIDPFTAVANRVIDELNRQTGKHYRHTVSNRTPIIARLKEGFTELNCTQVIANRCQRWLGTEQAQYLRPDTLFRPSKFESYLNDTGEVGFEQPLYDPLATQRMIDDLYPDDPNDLLDQSRKQKWIQ